MLKRLELIGFKSFADKTAFEFAAGITAVVGPNGSGKSNIVDAVKWVLGEQSAKSLRGGEMADVIFNGSATRKGAGLAEVSLVFDNSQQHLATDNAEVRITRRVYRDGQGEYLINGQLARLKDIKNLFLGTGAGAGAYSIIEQGRVDGLLQANQDDRRAIFEEAAGISRFKAKKNDCLRRLERVAQNLSRVSDILGEVDLQLRAVRQQAEKARKHQELAGRLKELRVGLGLRDFDVLASQLSFAEEEVATITQRLAADSIQSAEWAEAAKLAQAELLAVDLEVRSHEQSLTDTRERLAALAESIERDHSLARELAAEFDRCQARRQDLRQLADAAHAAVQLAAAEVASATAESAAEDGRATGAGEVVQAIAADIRTLRRQIEDDKIGHVERLREAARWQNDAVAVHALMDQLNREHDRLALRKSKAVEHLASLDVELNTLTRAEGDLHERLSAARNALAERTLERDQAKKAHEAKTHHLATLRVQAGGLESRIEVLERLERGQDGLGAGIRELRSRLADDSRVAGSVVGLVADCLTAPRAVAPLIDVALGHMAEHFLVCDPLSLEDWLRAHPLAGRVSFLPLGELAAIAVSDRPHPQAVPAWELVTCERPGLDDLPARLLGTTYVVPSLKVAHEAARRRPGLRFVTAAGELLEADGTLTVGPLNEDAGLLSRKSELHELRQQAAAVADQIGQGEAEIALLIEVVGTVSSHIDALRQEIEVIAEQSADLRARIGRHLERRQGLHEEVNLSRSELSGLKVEIGRNEKRHAEMTAHALAAEHAAQAIQAGLEAGERSIRQREQDQSVAQQAHTAAQVAVARANERLGAVHDRHAAAERHAAERRADLEAAERWRGEIEARQIRCRESIVAGEAEHAERTRQRGETESAIGECQSRRADIDAEQSKLAEQLGVARQQQQEERERLHTFELEVSQLRLRCDALVARLGEDYSLDWVATRVANDEAGGALAHLAGLSDDDAKAEVEELRKKLARLGHVNLDALEELGQVELKAQALQVQFDDLTHARHSLEAIIAKINTDSRTLFSETFAAVREQFQDLFQRLFGGGMADVVLDRPDDPLESGIEIVARPPGKELRSISLMSGGERTLTAVALLLAIFRAKPSPFCLLDEVDAALDEANTIRLATVLREFADASQFIVVTHAKRTMAAADVLYGVTMQESGISRRVAVRFDEWPEERAA